MGEIFAYNWKNIKSNKKPSCVWSIEIPNVKDIFDKPDINALIFNEDDGALYVGCGDNNVYIFNIETRETIKTFKGHTNYVHSLCFK